MSEDMFDKMPEEYRKELEVEEGWAPFGWSSWNPNNVICDACGSSNVKFLWRHGEVVGFNCDDCDNLSLDK